MTKENKKYYISQDSFEALDLTEEETKTLSLGFLINLIKIEMVLDELFEEIDLQVLLDKIAKFREMLKDDIKSTSISNILTSKIIIESLKDKGMEVNSLGDVIHDKEKHEKTMDIVSNTVSEVLSRLATLVSEDEFNKLRKTQQ